MMRSSVFCLFTLFCFSGFCQVQYAALVKKDRDWGAIDEKGNIIVSPTFALINRPHEVYMPYYSEEKEMLFPPRNGLIKYRKHGQFGFMKPGDEEVIPDIYEKASSFWGGFSVVYDGFQYRMINRSGEDVVKKSRYPLKGYANGRILYEKGRKYGYFNYHGGKDISAEFKDARAFSEGYACVKKKDGWGVIDTIGRVVLNYQYEDMRSCGQGLFGVKSDLGWAFIDLDGKEVLQAMEYKDVAQFQNGLCAVKNASGWGLINENGEEVVHCHYKEMEFGEKIRARSYSGYFFYNLDGTKVADKLFSDAGMFHEGLTWVKSGEGYGIIDDKGNYIIEPIFDDARNCGGNLCAVKQDGKWGFIDLKGNRVIDFIFHDVTQFYPMEGIPPVLKLEK